MTTILLLICLLLHVVAFYFIVVLYTKYSTIKELSNSQRSMLEETESSMTSFLIEMKDENERLIHYLNQISEHTPQYVKGIETKVSETLQQNDKLEDVKLPEYITELNDVKDIIEINQSSQKKYPPYAIEAINLYENGHTVDQIAKIVNKGKTEIELLLKFRQK